MMAHGRWWRAKIKNEIEKGNLNRLSIIFREPS